MTTVRSVPAVAALACIIGLALVATLDAFGLPRPVLIGGFLLLVLVVIAVAGITCWTRDPGQMSVAGRSVAPVLNGLGIAAEAMSLAAILGIFGAVLAWGHDGLVHLYGIVAGVALIPLVLAAPLRRSGAVTVPEFVGLRFGTGLPRALAVLVLVVSCLLIAAAQLTALGTMVERLLGLPYWTVVLTAGGLVMLSAGLGGNGAVARIQPVLFALAAIALLLLVVLAVLDRTGWMSAQLGYGGLVGEVVAQEQALLRRALADPRTMKPIATPFLTLDTPNYLGILLALALGFAALPHVLGRAVLAADDRSARRAFVCGVLCLVVVASALPALATIARLELGSLVAKGTRIAALPDWLLDLGRLGVVKVCGTVAGDAEAAVAACRKVVRHPGVLRLQDLSVDAQALLAVLPRVTGQPFAVLALMAAGLLAAGLAALQGPLMAIAISLAHDVRGGLIDPALPGVQRVATARMALTGGALAAALIALWRPADMLTLLVWGAALAASGLLPVLLLGLVWRRINAAGAIAGMVIGFGLCLAYIVTTRFFAPQFHSLFAGLADVSPGAQSTFIALQQAAATAAPGPARAAADLALDQHAQRIVGWWGLKPAGAALIAVPAGGVATLLTSLVARGAFTLSPAGMASLRRPGLAPPLSDQNAAEPR